MSHTVASTTTNYLWDVNRSLPVVLQDGTNTYVYGIDLIASIDGSNNETYYMTDGLGSTTELTDDDGDVTDSYEYDVFGAVRSHTVGSSTQPFLFTGEQTDADSGMQYLRARYYDPATGRFIGRDPFAGLLGAPSTQHSYGYAFSNPVNYVDPTGRYSVMSLLNDLRPAYSCGLEASLANFSCIGDYIGAIAGYNQFVFDFIKRFGTLNCLNAVVTGVLLVATATAPGLGASPATGLILYKVGLLLGDKVALSFTLGNNLSSIDNKEGVTVGNVLATTGSVAAGAAVLVSTLNFYNRGLGWGAPYLGTSFVISAAQCGMDVANG